MFENRKIQLETEVVADTSGLQDIKDAAQDMAQAVQQAGQQAGAGLAKVGDGAAPAAQKVDAATRSIISSIQRSTAAMKAGEKGTADFYEALGQTRGIDVSALKGFSDELRKVEAAQKQAAQAAKANAFVDSIRQQAESIGKSRSQLIEMQAAQLGVADKAAPYIKRLKEIEDGQNRVGLSAKQTAAALRGVPAQFTDIVTSLASGQNPLTVILQQGGQLKDIFGGAVPAARALGGYIVGLVTPLTIALGAAGALAVALHQGSKEASEFARAMILSGDAAGVTAGQLQEMAKSINAAGAGTRGAAAEALAAMVANGNLAGDSLERFARIAVRMEKETGQSFAETAKQFAELRKSPLEAATRLNEATNFLTASVARQIAVLQEQGRTADAARVAQTAYADALEGRLARVEQSLGLVERAWRGVAGGAKWAWDKMLDVGRPDTLEEQLARVGREIDKARNQPFNASAFGGNAEARAQLQANLALQASLQEQIRLQRKGGEAAAQSAQQTKARLAFDKQGEEFLSKQARMEREIAEARALGLAAGAKEEEIQKRIGAIREKFADKKSNSAREADQTRTAALEAELARFKDALQEERDALAHHERLLQGQYQAGSISLKQFYDSRVEAIREGARKSIEEMEREKARIAQDRDFFDKKGDTSRATQLQGRIDDLSREQAKVGTKAEREIELSNQASAESFRQLSDEITNYRANLLQMQGDEAGAAKLRTDLAIQQAQRLAKRAEGSPQAITAERQAGDAQARRDLDVLNEAKRQTSIINQALMLEEDRIADAQRRGAITSTEALSQLGGARRRVIDQLEEIVRAQEEVARSRPQDYVLQIDTARARQELERLKDELDPLAEKFRGMFTDATGNLFADLANDPKNGKDAIKRWASSITSELNREFGRDLATKLFGKEGLLGNLPGTARDLFGKDAKAAPAPLVDTSPLAQSLNALRAAGVDPSTQAFGRLTTAIDNSIAALGRMGAGPAGVQPSAPGMPPAGFPQFDDDGNPMPPVPTGEQKVLDQFTDAQRSVSRFGDANTEAMQAVLLLAGAAGKGGSALSMLPYIINLIMAATSTTGGGGGGGFGATIGSLIGSFITGGASGFQASFSQTALGSSGFGTGLAYGNQDFGLFLHEGGIVGKDEQVRKSAGLKANEVPAILMGGPKGVREEVLTADDPRHSDNLSPAMKRLIERMPRYHDGGVVGEKSEHLTGGMNYLTPPAPVNPPARSEAGQETDWSKRPLIVQVQGAPGLSRDSAMQQGREIGRGIQRSMSRNGR